MQGFRGKQKEEPATMQLSASKADSSDPQNHVVVVNRVLLVFVGLLASSTAFLGHGVYLQALKPTEILYVDRCSEMPPSFFTTTFASEFTIADARNFFINTAKLRYGWSSSSIGRDIDDFHRQSVTQQREADSRYFSEIVEVPGDAYRNRKPRMTVFAEGGIRNSLLLPSTIDQIACARDPGKEGWPPAWHCKMGATLVTEYVSLGPAQHLPVKEDKLIIFGTFIEAKRTVQTPFGLMVGRMEGHGQNEEDKS